MMSPILACNMYELLADDFSTIQLSQFGEATSLK